MNLSLRPLVGRDAVWLDNWIDEVARRVGYETMSAASLFDRKEKQPCLRLRIIMRGDAPVGLAIYKMHHPKEGTATFELIATPPEHARKGAGMTAVALAEIEMQAECMTSAFAPAAAVNGISMYFWIRLGYAPLMRDAWPGTCQGIAWLERSLGE